jgi:hypothetical protein
LTLMARCWSGGEEWVISSLSHIVWSGSWWP